MLTVHIGWAEVPLAEASERWLHQQINRRRADHASSHCERGIHLAGAARGASDERGR